MLEATSGLIAHSDILWIEDHRETERTGDQQNCCSNFPCFHFGIICLVEQMLESYLLFLFRSNIQEIGFGHIFDASAHTRSIPKSPKNQLNILLFLFFAFYSFLFERSFRRDTLNMHEIVMCIFRIFFPLYEGWFMYGCRENEAQSQHSKRQKNAVLFSQQRPPLGNQSSGISLIASKYIFNYGINWGSAGKCINLPLIARFHTEPFHLLNCYSKSIIASTGYRWTMIS